jgi:flagellin
MRVNQFDTTHLNSQNQKINTEIQKLADPSKTDKTVNQFIQDVYENDINTSLQQVNSLNDAIGFMQTADGALNSISDNLSQIKTLQTAANNATLNSDNIAAINSQINALSQNINDTLTQTTYNSKSVFGEFNFNGIDVNTSMPSFSTDSIDTFESSLNDARNSVGSFTNEASATVNNLSQFIVNTSGAKSQNETDVAKTAVNLQNDTLKLNAALLAQAHNINISQQNLMNLLK